MSLFGFIGKAISTVGDIATSVIPGSLDDKLFGAVKQSGILGTEVKRRTATATMPQIIAQPVPIAGPGVPQLQLPTPDSIKVSGGKLTIGGSSIFSTEKPSATAYFGTPGMSGVSSGSSSTAQQMAMACALPGHRMNKSSYFLRDGTFVPAGTKCVKSRRRNPLNPRALSRAMSRMASAKRAAKALDRFEVKGRRCR